MITETTLSIFQKAEELAGANPIMMKLCSFFRRHGEEITTMQQTMASDETLREFISNVFGIWGGGSLEEGWYEYAGGSKPRLEIQDRNFKSLQKMEGQQIVSAFRHLFNIPANGQLNLF